MNSILIALLCFSSNNYLQTRQVGKWFLPNENFQVMMNGNEQ